MVSEECGEGPVDLCGSCSCWVAAGGSSLLPPLRDNNFFIPFSEGHLGHINIKYCWLHTYISMLGGCRRVTKSGCECGEYCLWVGTRAGVTLQVYHRV